MNGHQNPKWFSMVVAIVSMPAYIATVIRGQPLIIFVRCHPLLNVELILMVVTFYRSLNYRIG